MRLVTFAAMIIVVTACAARQPGEVATALTGNHCGPDRVPDQDTTWQEVTGNGFSYCVPVTWQPVGSQARRWRAAAVDFEWENPSSRRPVPFAVRRMDRRGSMEPAGSIEVSPPESRVVLSEVIDGRTIRLTLENPAGRYTRSATEVMDPALVLTARARTPEAARDVVSAFRSIRFVKKP